jgi:ABC-2 type transport system permease protein
MRSSGSTAVLAVDSSGTGIDPGGLQAPAGIRLVAAASDPDADLRHGRIDGVLRLSGGRGAMLALRGDNPGTVRLLQVASAQIITRQRLQGAIEQVAPGGSGAVASALNAALDAGGVPATYLHGGPEFDTLDYEAPALIGFFGLFFVFLLTAVSFLRERTSGTLERLLVSPLGRMELVSGYTIGFGLFALAQAFLVVFVSVVVLRIHYRGGLLPIFIVVTLLSLGAVNLGIFCSTYARTELQAVQFIPIVIVPQGLLSGLLFTVESMPRWLQVVAHMMPMTYAIDALRAVMIAGAGWTTAALLRDLVVLFAFAAVFLLAGAMTLRRDVG